MAAKNTCTTLALYDAEFNSLLGPEFQRVRDVLLASDGGMACVLCRATPANGKLFVICQGGDHLACGKCKNSDKLFDFSTSRAGPVKKCAVTCCSANFLERAIPQAPAVSKLVTGTRDLLDQSFMDAQAAQHADNAGAELRRDLVDVARSRKRVRDAEGDEKLSLQVERAAKRLALKEKKIAEAEAKRVATLNEFMVSIYQAKFGAAVYNEVKSEALEIAEVGEVGGGRPDLECGECMDEEE